MKKTISIILALILSLTALCASAESSVDEQTVFFEKCVNYVLYNVFAEYSNASVDKIEVYTLPSGFSKSCTYYYAPQRKYDTESKLTEDKPFFRVQFTVENKYGATSSLDLVYYAWRGFEELNKLLSEDKPDRISLIMACVGCTDGWPAYLLHEALAQGFPFAVLDLDVEYLVAHYNPAQFT